jgi:hypothetical protein
MTNLSLKVQCLPNSPDLTTHDFHLWWYLKDAVYHTKPATMEELQEEIKASHAAIPEHKLDGLSHSQGCQIQDCLDVNGDHFEHELNFQHVTKLSIYTKF